MVAIAFVGHFAIFPPPPPTGKHTNDANAPKCMLYMHIKRREWQRSGAAPFRPPIFSWPYYNSISAWGFFQPHRYSKNKNTALMVMQHLYSYMRRGNESWTWQLSPQDVHWYHLVSVGASKSGDGIQKKNCWSLWSMWTNSIAAPFNFPQIYSPCREICMLFTHISISTQREALIKGGSYWANKDLPFRNRLSFAGIQYVRFEARSTTIFPIFPGCQMSSVKAIRFAEISFSDQPSRLPAILTTCTHSSSMAAFLICPSCAVWHVCLANCPTAPSSHQSAYHAFIPMCFNGQLSVLVHSINVNRVLHLCTSIGIHLSLSWLASQWWRFRLS